MESVQSQEAGQASWRHAVPSVPTAPLWNLPGPLREAVPRHGTSRTCSELEQLRAPDERAELGVHSRPSFSLWLNYQFPGIRSRTEL